MSTSTSLTELLLAESPVIGELAPLQLQALERHYQLLLQWNRKMNLTTVTDLPEAATRHYGESLFLARRLSPGRVVDVGSGAGFPGIPLAIARPDCMVDLVEAHQRKAVFLREACRGISNLRVLSVRAETLKSADYDWLVSRAVNPSELMGLRLSRRFAVLLGVEDVPCLASGDVIPLPWGYSRVLAIGDVPS